MNKNISRKVSLFLPPRSSFSSRKEWEAACWRKVLKSEELMDLLTTSNERHNIVMRAAALDGFAAGKSYRQISRELFLSLQTLNVIKKGVSERSYKSYLERSKKERKRKIYSPDRRERKPEGRPVRTKYGTVYLPY